MGLRDYTSKEVLNKVLYNNTALRAYSLSEGLNTILDAGNNRLKVRLEGGTVAGDLIVTGTLEVQGATTIIKSETIQVTDKTFELAVPSSGSPSDATSDGGGIILKGSTDKTILWNNANDWWNFNQGINVTGNAVVSGTVTSTFIGNVTGNVSGTAPAGTLTGATLASGVTASSLTSVGTLGNTTLQASGNSVYPLTINNSSGQAIGQFYADGNGDGGFYIKDSSGNTDVRLLTDGDSFFKGGSVGIGASPQSGNSISPNLTVEGTKPAVLIKESGRTDSFLGLWADGGNSQLHFDDSGIFSIMHADDTIGTNSTAVATFHGTGKVGINEDSPKGMLDIDCSSLDAVADLDDPNDYAIVIRNNSTTDTGNGIAFTNDSADNVGGAILHIDKGSNNLGDLVFYTNANNSGNPSERMRIDSGGVIQLEDGMIVTKNNGSDTNAYMSLGHDADYGQFGAGESGIWGVNNNDIIFGTDDALRITIKANGDTQFGDSNGTGDIYHYGAGKFLINDVADSASSPTYSFNSDTDTGMFRYGADSIGFATGGQLRAYIEDGNGTEARLIIQGQQLGTSGSAEADIWFQGHHAGANDGYKSWGLIRGRKTNATGGAVGGQMQFYVNNTSNAQTKVMELNESAEADFGSAGTGSKFIRLKGGSDGQVNIGGAGTSEDVRFQFYNANGIVGYIKTNGTSTSFNTSSDYRLKENEVPISDGLARLNQLKPYKFNFKNDKDKTLDGFFAHEVQSIVPQAVTGEKDSMTVDEFNGDEVMDIQGIDHSKLVPLLVSAVQELSAEVEALKNA